MKINIAKPFRMPHSYAKALKKQAIDSDTNVSKLLTSIIEKYVNGEITLPIPTPEKSDRVAIYTDHALMMKFQEKAAADGLSMEKAVTLLVGQTFLGN